MILVVPSYQLHELTAAMVATLAATVESPDFELVLVDNGSPDPYRADEWGRLPFAATILRNRRNRGNFWPLRQGADLGGSDVVALAHNDLVYWEPGWDLRVEAAFRDDPRLGLVGFAGSDTIQPDGLRGPTMSNFRGERGHATAEWIGPRIRDLRPAAAVDGLFMAFRREALEAISLTRLMPPAHWYDLIWGAEVARAGWRIATLGVDVDHVGWSTEVGLAAELDAEWRRWAAEAGVDPGDDVMAAIRRVGRRRWEAFRPSYWPCFVDADWTHQRREPDPVVAVTMMRNEADVAEPVVRHMLDQCDRVIVADNGSDDGTREILDAIAADEPRLTVVDEPRFAYRQSETMNRLAAMAPDAAWIVPFDADEWWDSADGRVADVLRALPAHLDQTGTRVYDMIPQPSDPVGPDPFARVTMTRPGSFWSRPEVAKAAYRPGAGRAVMQGNHGLEGRPLPAIGPLRVRHVPFRSLEQATAKLRHGRVAVLAAGLGPGSGTHWQEWGGLDDDGLARWWAEWTRPDGLEVWR